VAAHFHQRHVFRGPPIIPDGQISQVRFETLAFFRGPFQARRGLNAGSCTPLLVLGLPLGLASRPASGDCTGFIKPATHAGVETAKCPESLCPLPVSPPAGRRLPPPERTLLLRHRSYGLMRQTQLALPSFGFHLVPGVSAGCYQPLLPAGSSRRYL
jgi:hypothetical protein